MSSRSARRRLREMLGVPVVPPGRVTRGLLAVRRGIARAHRSSAPPQIRVLEGLLSTVDARVLGLLVELDIATHTARPAEAASVADACGSDPDRLERVLRFAVARGYLGRDRRGRYVANDVTALLRDDAADPWTGWVRFATSPLVWDSIRHLDGAVRAERSGTELATGKDFFTHLEHDRATGRAFNQAMEAGSRLQSLALAATLEWDDVAHVCDVGGGTGVALEVLLEHHEHLRATLLDLPDVVLEATPAVAAVAAAGGVELVGGDFFAEVPAGADRYLLLAVLHDWADDEASRILRRVGDAAGATGEVVVVESVRPDEPVDDFAFVSDLLMLALASGRERSRAELDALFGGAGLAVRSVVPLPTGFTAFLLEAEPL